MGLEIFVLTDHRAELSSVEAFIAQKDALILNYCFPNSLTPQGVVVLNDQGNYFVNSITECN